MQLALSEVQKAVLWLLYFWQHIGFRQIGRPSEGAIQRNGWDAAAQPIGIHGFGLDALLLDDGRMRTTWNYRNATDATRLALVDRPLIEVPLIGRFESSDVDEALATLVGKDGFVKREMSGTSDATRLQSVELAPNVILSVGIPISVESGAHRYWVPGLAYWVSNRRCALRQLEPEEYQPWCAVGDKAVQVSLDDPIHSGIVHHRAQVASNLAGDIVSPVEVRIPRGGKLVPMERFRIRCGVCAAQSESACLLLGRPCPRCGSPVEFCKVGRSAMKGQVERPNDSELVPKEAWTLTTEGYHAARWLCEGAKYTPFALLGGITSEAIALSEAGLSHDQRSRATLPLDHFDHQIIRFLCSNNKTEEALPQQMEIAVAIDLGMRRLRSALRKLEQVGIIHRPMGPRNGYELTERGRAAASKEDATKRPHG